MPTSSKVIVLKRMVVGDEDLLIKLYGWGGVMRLFVREGALPERGYIGIFEPFNVLELSYRQAGDIILPLDIKKVDFLSYLALESYERYLWMCSVGNFFMKWVRYYDSQLFELLLKYLTIKVDNINTFLLRFKIDFLKALGVYTENIFEEDARKVINTIESADKRLLERIILSKEFLNKVEKAIENHLEKSL